MTGTDPTATTAPPGEAPPPISITRPDDIEVRGRALAGELIGRVGFTEMFLLDLDGELPSPGRVQVVDAILVALMEHGTTPSTLATRLVLDGAPESLQGAVAAGLLATGSRFLGTIDEAATSLQAVVAAGGDLETAAATEVARRRAAGEPIPGLGHNLHADFDPRVAELRRVVAEAGLSGPHQAALDALQRAACAALGKRLIANAAGAVGAALSDLGYAPDQVRGFALVARCAGLFAHAVDERRAPIARAVWREVHGRENERDSEGRTA